MMDESAFMEMKMATYRAMANNLIVKSTSKKLTAEEALFKETALATFREDLRIHMMILEHNRKNLEKELADGTFDETTGGGSRQGTPDEEP